MKKDNDKIEELQYRTIEKGFYEVYAWTYFDKIAIEGNVCSGILLNLMEQTKKDKGKIVRVKSGGDWDFKSNTKKIQKENKDLKLELKRLKEKISKIKRISK